MIPVESDALPDNPLKHLYSNLFSDQKPISIAINEDLEYRPKFMEELQGLNGKFIADATELQNPETFTK